MALEVKLGHDLRRRQQLVLTPQLQQAIKILQISLPELEALVQNESVADTAVIAKKSKKSK
jgi:DNA-directed RNA polymerase specialized sigma54-like protein